MTSGWANRSPVRLFPAASDGVEGREEEDEAVGLDDDGHEAGEGDALEKRHPAPLSVDPALRVVEVHAADRQEDDGEDEVEVVVLGHEAEPARCAEDGQGGEALGEQEQQEEGVEVRCEDEMLDEVTPPPPVEREQDEGEHQRHDDDERLGLVLDDGVEPRAVLIQRYLPALQLLAHHAPRALPVRHPAQMDVERRGQRVEARQRLREEEDDVAEDEEL